LKFLFLILVLICNQYTDMQNQKIQSVNIYNQLYNVKNVFLTFQNKIKLNRKYKIDINVKFKKSL
jgi:hypothetical protein